MSDFWATFLGGVASGILLLALTLFVRSLVSTRSQGRPILKVSTKQLGPIVVVVVGGIVAASGVFLRQGESDKIAVAAIALGALIVLMGVVVMLFGLPNRK